MKCTVNHKNCAMMTKCKFIDNEYKILFWQLKSPWPIKSNTGEWYLEDGRINIVLIHCVEARYGFLGDILMKMIIGKYFISSHADKILNVFENYTMEG